ncbi:kinase-like protein [Auriscalpium vulgare]|uniref:Kinase-like protein n=1 Tax=Auriscalpium vulgare TaxID=40419 RepID=A0ACB8S030_9AGAM|nr:kinase-like protein [Auriscalpium vulgare]
MYNHHHRPALSGLPVQLLPTDVVLPRPPAPRSDTPPPDYDFPLPGPPQPAHDGLPSSSSLPQGPLAMSPAAMFLSAFSPAASSAPLPDDEGERVAGYTLGPIIGYGGFSTIRKAFSPSGATLAVKTVRRADLASQANTGLARERLATESAVWRTLTHEHILPLFDSVHTPYADYFFMLLCPAGSLFDILSRDGRPALPHDDVGMMFRQVVRGLRYLHEQAGIVHGDMKLENVLVDESGVCRIADFGMARPIEHTPSTAKPAQPVRPHRSLKSQLPTHLSLLRHHGGSRHRNSSPLPSSAQTRHAVYDFPPGSLPYAAPELLHPPSLSHPHRADPVQDIWALGVMLYALLTGRLPFMDSFEPRLTMKILHGVYEAPRDIGRGAELTLQGCLEPSVTRRWTIAAVDEVAWSVGWGATSDDPFTDEKEIESMVHEVQQRSRPHSPQRRSLSRSRSPGSTVFDPDTRNSSAVFLSPSPHPRSLSRSSSRRRAHVAALTLPNQSLSPPLTNSSPPGRERGRDPSKSRARASTRSPSPSVAPLTPVDVRQGMLFAPISPPSETRGRKAVRQLLDSELGVVNESTRWALSPDSYDADSLHAQQAEARSPSRGLPRAVVSRHQLFGRRSGSQPSSNAAPWTAPHSRASVVSSAMTMGESTFSGDDASRRVSGATPISIPSRSNRSKSLDQG